MHSSAEHKPTFDDTLFAFWNLVKNAENRGLAEVVKNKYLEFLRHLETPKSLFNQGLIRQIKLLVPKPSSVIDSIVEDIDANGDEASALIKTDYDNDANHLIAILERRSPFKEQKIPSMKTGMTLFELPTWTSKGRAEVEARQQELLQKDLLMSTSLFLKALYEHAAYAKVALYGKHVLQIYKNNPKLSSSQIKNYLNCLEIIAKSYEHLKKYMHALSYYEKQATVRAEFGLPFSAEGWNNHCRTTSHCLAQLLFESIDHCSEQAANRMLVTALARRKENHKLEDSDHRTIFSWITLCLRRMTPRSETILDFLQQEAAAAYANIVTKQESDTLHFIDFHADLGSLYFARRRWIQAENCFKTSIDLYQKVATLSVASKITMNDVFAKLKETQKEIRLGGQFTHRLYKSAASAMLELSSYETLNRKKL